ncbi:MAG: hypothetical protein ABW003_03485 [Microvirga sp.]
MKVRLLFVAGGALLMTSAAATAGPCADQIAALSEQIGGSGAQVPVAGQAPHTQATAAMNEAARGRATSPEDVRRQMQGMGTAADTTGTVRPQAGRPDASATAREVPAAGQVPETQGGAAMNMAARDRAASPADVRAQNMGAPTAAELAHRQGSTQTMAALQHARMLDSQGKEAECMSALQEARRMHGIR